MAFVTSFAAYDAMVSEESKQVGQHVDGKYVNGCSDHKSSARPKRKGKQKKVPQRGLGVAQLERMRMEEQKKKEIGSSSSSLMVPVARGVTVPTSNSNYDIPVPSFNFCPVLPDSTVPPPWEFTPQVVSVDSSESAFGFGFPFSVDQAVLVGSSLAAADQKPLPYQQGREKVPTMVNVSSTNSCSSGVSLQIEPPSNQICLSNNKAAWPQDGKMVGLKRPLPCSFENAIISPPAAFQWSTNTVPQFSSYVNNCYKSASWQDLCNYDSGSTISREGRSPSSSGVMQLHESDNICCGESNEALDSGFLSLRPPSLSAIPGLYGEYCYPSSQVDGNVQKLSPNSSPFSEMEPRKPIYYSFLPEHLALNHCDKQSDRKNDGLEALDLTLKL